jgi:hypothetical protein
MTTDDLRTLVRDDVTATEPATGLDAMVPVRLGRRRLRARRLAAGAATAAVVAAGAAVAVPLATGEGSASPDHGYDPVTQKALADYDAQRMPQLMDDHVRSVLERSVPELGPVTFRAGDANGDELPPELYDKASGMSVTYGPREHQFRVELVHAGSEAEGSPERYCASGLAGGYDLECTVRRTSAGDVVISTLAAVRPFRSDPDGGWMAVTADDLSTVDPDRLWFVRGTKVIKSKTLVTWAQEQVKAPTREAAEAAFQVPLADLEQIGTDPVLVIPPPPVADDGCGPFVLDAKHGKMVCKDDGDH